MQGLCGLEDIDDYELADKGDHLASEDGYGDGGADADVFSDWDAGGETSAPAAVISEEQRDRMEQNKREALERAAARKAAAAVASGPNAGGVGGGPPPPEDEDMDIAWAEAHAHGAEEFDPFDEEVEAGFNAFDEEAEAEVFGDFSGHADILTEESGQSAGHAEGTSASEPVAMGIDEPSAQVDSAERMREEARAAAEALEAGFDDDEF